jgi:hypothetical protein
VLERYRRRRQLGRVRPGDGSPLPAYRRWQVLTRSLFLLDVPRPGGGLEQVAVDVRHLRDSSSARRPAMLYRDGVQVAQADLPATFPVADGVVEVATTAYGLRRIHHVAADGTEQVLRPHPRSPEGLRARFERRFPRLSTLVGAVSVVVLLVGLTTTLATVAEKVTRVPQVAATLGVFTSPVPLGGWLAVALPVAATVAAVERSTALRSHWLLRAGA